MFEISTTNFWKRNTAVMKLSPEFEKAAVDIYKLEIEPPYDKKLIVSNHQPS